MDHCIVLKTLYYWSDYRYSLGSHFSYIFELSTNPQISASIFS